MNATNTQVYVIRASGTISARDITKTSPLQSETGFSPKEIVRVALLIPHQKEYLQSSFHFSNHIKGSDSWSPQSGFPPPYQALGRTLIEHFQTTNCHGSIFKVPNTLLSSPKLLYYGLQAQLNTMHTSVTTLSGLKCSRCPSQSHVPM
jgi:hypothetical protein